MLSGGSREGGRGGWLKSGGGLLIRVLRLMCPADVFSLPALTPLFIPPTPALQVDAQLAELQSKQAQRAREWQGEEEARAIRAQVGGFGGREEEEGTSSVCVCVRERESPQLGGCLLPHLSLGSAPNPSSPPPFHVQTQHEDARLGELARQAEEGAAQGAVRRELMVATLSLEDQLIKVRGGKSVGKCGGRGDGRRPSAALRLWQLLGSYSGL